MNLVLKLCDIKEDSDSSNRTVSLNNDFIEVVAVLFLSL